MKLPTLSAALVSGSMITAACSEIPLNKDSGVETTDGGVPITDAGAPVTQETAEQVVRVLASMNKFKGEDHGDPVEKNYVRVVSQDPVIDPSDLYSSSRPFNSESRVQSHNGASPEGLIAIRNAFVNGESVGVTGPAYTLDEIRLFPVLKPGGTLFVDLRVSSSVCRVQLLEGTDPKQYDSVNCRSLGFSQFTFYVTHTSGTETDAVDGEDSDAGASGVRADEKFAFSDCRYGIYGESEFETAPPKVAELDLTDACSQEALNLTHILNTTLSDMSVCPPLRGDFTLRNFDELRTCN